MWGSGDYTPLGEAFAPIHARLLDACEPLAGKRLLDVATGTGGVASAAAARGAEVVASDFSPVMLARAAQRVPAGVELVEADAEDLPFADASVDVVTSSFGMVFARDCDAVAREVARVCRPGGRLGYTVWLPDDSRDALYDGFEEPPSLAFETTPWTTEEAARALLEPAFAVRFERCEFVSETESTDELWDFNVMHVPPFHVFVASLDAARQAELRRRFDELYRPGSDGRVRESDAYLLVTGDRTHA
jgi:SAM-dependent methyltransferase